MKGKLIILLFIIITSLNIRAAAKDDEPLKKMGKINVIGIDTTGIQVEYLVPDENLNDIFEEKLDSLVNTWYSRNIFIPDSSEINFAADTAQALPDSVYIKRLQNIEAVVDLSYNKTVKNFILLYTVQRREQVEIMLGLAAHYFPMIEGVLDRYNLPLELKYLPIIESALNPRARSRAGAVGLWQFMYGTARLLKLDVTSFVDERSDPLKSTEAAAAYLKQLYDIYHDWQLVIAAYNCGPGNVNKAIRRSGGKKNYWSIYYRLPRETRGYVPAFIAATYVMNYFADHGLLPQLPELPLATDTIMVHRLLHFDQVAATLGIDIDELRDLNPMYRRDVIPAKEDKPYPLRLPVTDVADFIDKESSVFSYKRDKYFPDNTLVQPTSRAASYYAPIDIKGKAKIYYRVKSGDNIGYIAQWFHVRASDLRYWNNIHRNLIRVGEKLLIYVPEKQKSHYEKVNEMALEAKQQMNGQTTSVETTTEVKSPDPDYIYYTVKRGDNLWTIARKFPGVSNEDIMQLNNIKDARRITAGQKLKIKKKA